MNILAPVWKHRKMTASSLFDKVWTRHEVLARGQATLLYIDRHLIHEVTSPQAFEGLRLAGRQVRRPDLTFATLDHNIPTDNQLTSASPCRGGRSKPSGKTAANSA